MYLVQIFVRLIGVEDDLPVVQNDPSRIQKVLTIFNEDLLSPGKNLKSKKVKKNIQLSHGSEPAGLTRHFI